ncbi:tigger transposable element-derived protein 7 [Trichinella spiralis]|uniref:tigger transposable element-derived protein 7 n=1 Tax=Trichinella spiralis TaxID=6334 RepID=UPI0001EFE229|nr:tigger transposable element-derived protein 7 [Trichinella spiralis]
MTGMQKLPVIYDYQTKAWMTEDIFFHWCDEIFILHVKEYQKTKRSAKPMDQTVIQSLKKRYRKELLRGIVLSEPDGGDLASQLKSINLKDYCYMIAQVWESISGNTLRVSWNKLLGYNEECVPNQ